MKKIRILLSILILICISCQEEENLEGHWHFYSKYSLNNSYTTIDISKDSITFLNKNSIFEKLEGRINKSQKKIFFPGECGTGIFDYRAHNGKMYLKNHLDELTGEKCDSNCCDKVSDILFGTNVNVNIPIKNNLERYSTNKINSHFRLTFIFGTPKNNSLESNSDSIHLVNCGKFYNNLEIAEQIDIAKNHISEDRLKYIDVKILADTKTPISKITSLIESLNAENLDRIWLALFDNFKQKLIYIPVKKEEFSQITTLMELLK